MKTTQPTLELLAIATTALRDLHMGYPPKEIAAATGQGLEVLLTDLVTHLRGQGIDDEGGWDCDATNGIAVAATSKRKIMFEIFQIRPIVAQNIEVIAFDTWAEALSYQNAKHDPCDRAELGYGLYAKNRVDGCWMHIADRGTKTEIKELTDLLIGQMPEWPHVDSITFNRPPQSTGDFVEADEIVQDAGDGLRIARAVEEEIRDRWDA